MNADSEAMGPTQTCRSAVTAALAEGMALFLGLFSLINVAGNAWSEGFDMNLWWIDLRWAPEWLADSLLGAGGTLLLAYGLGLARSPWLRNALGSFTLFFLTTAILNTAVFYYLWLQGAIRPGFPIPLSAWVAAAMLLLATRCRHPVVAVRQWPKLAAFAGCVLLLPLALMIQFGKTDYRRPAQAAVVFGARVYANGQLSDALADRVRTACELYREGLVPLLVMSGGPGDGSISEPQAMKRAAMGQGVPAEAIVLDQGGFNTEASVLNTTRLFTTERGLTRVLAVSHGYHLPRVRLAYRRAGLEVASVPARESYVLRQLPFNMVREIAALWVYFAKPCLSQARG